MCSAGLKVERAFCILKARWRYQLNCLDHNEENVPNVIITCYILRNICQIKGNTTKNEWCSAQTWQQEHERRARRVHERNSLSADVLRDVLKNYIKAKNEGK